MKMRDSVPRLAVSTCASSSNRASTSLVGEAANGSGKMNGPHYVGPACLKEAVHGTLSSTFYNAKDIGDHLIGNTEEAAFGSGEMNGPCHGDPICLNQTSNDSLHLILGNAKDIGSQLSGSSGKAADGAGRINNTWHVDTTCLNESVESILDSTISDTTCLNESVESSLGSILSVANDINDHLNRNRSKQFTTSSLCEESGAIAIQDVSFQNISVLHSSEEVYDGDYNLQSENNRLKDTTSCRDFELPDTSFSSIVMEEAFPDDCLIDKQHIYFDSPNDTLSNSLKESDLVEYQNKSSSFGSGLLSGSNSVELTSLSVKDHKKEPFRCSIQSGLQSGMSASNHKISDYNGTVDGAFKEDIYVPDSANIEECSSVHTALTRSGQLCRTGLLQDIIEDSKCHKKTLFSAMESILKLMREVELEEKIAQQAREETVNGGFEIRPKVEELKKMLNRAREANNMHSGDVYGERAILATEMRELQSRLLVLSDEKDDSLSILKTMRLALESRMAAAEAERISAEQEKCKKEEFARRALAEQELIMEKVVQESKILQHEAEENAKLREFLVDRGHFVDMLQGEICVICEDVELLKEKYDASVPLGECLSSKQTSCILASSQKSRGSEKVVEKANWLSANDSFLIPSVKQVSESDQEECVEEGWELF